VTSAPTNHWKLGLFVVVGFVLTLTSVAVLTARTLRKEIVHYISYFDESVQGLEVGSPIKFRGVTIGTVGGIDIAPDHRHVEVQLDLGVAELSRLGLNKKDGPVREDTRKKLEVSTDLRAQLASAGLTGVKFLQLDFFPVADNPAPVLPFPVPENYIPTASSTMKNIEDSLVRTMNRLPEVVDQLGGILSKVDGMLGELKDKELTDHLMATLASTNRLIGDAQHKLGEVEADKLSQHADKTLVGLNDTVTRMNRLLASIDGDKGLLASVARASDAVGDTAHNADGLGGQLEDALKAVQEAAKSIHKLADGLDKDPDMLVKGRGRPAERNR
jgi:phospholipid/cholesterol/gamma-HCH transport system substrate-binding protein